MSLNAYTNAEVNYYVADLKIEGATLAQIPLGSSCLDSARSTYLIEQVETSVSSVSSHAVPTWRTTNKL